MGRGFGPSMVSTPPARLSHSILLFDVADVYRVFEIFLNHILPPELLSPCSHLLLFLYFS